MTDTRTRVRRPDAEAETEVEAVTTGEGLAEALNVPVEAITEEVKPTPLDGPFRLDGFNIVDRHGRRIMMAGVEGDVVRTGPGIAASVLKLLNAGYAI